MRNGKGWAIGWIAAVAIGGTALGVSPARAEDSASRLRERLRGVTLPRVEFRRAGLIDVLTFLCQAVEEAPSP